MLNLPSWFIYALVPLFGFSIAIVLWKIIMNKGLSPLLTTTYTFTITAIMLLGYVLITQKSLFPSSLQSPFIISLLIVGCVIVAISNVASFTSVKLASNPGYTRAVTSGSILLIYIISMFVFKVRFDVIAFIGILLIMAGVVLLSRVT